MNPIDTFDPAATAARWLGEDIVVVACDGDLYGKYGDDLPHRRALHVRVSESGHQHLSLRLAKVAA